MKINGFANTCKDWYLILIMQSKKRKNMLIMILFIVRYLIIVINKNCYQRRFLSIVGAYSSNALHYYSKRITTEFQHTTLIYFSIANTEMEISMQSYSHWIIEKRWTYRWQKPRLLGFSIAANYSRLMLKVFY